MLHTICATITDMLDDHNYGEFIEAGMRCARDVVCRSAERLEAEDRAAHEALNTPGNVTFDPKGKSGKASNV